MDIMSALTKWEIKYPGSPPSKHDVRTFLEAWAKNPRSNLLITEDDSKDFLSAESSTSVFGWLAEQLVSNGKVTSFITRINAVTYNPNHFEEREEVTWKVQSADIVWVEELVAGDLTNNQRNLLYMTLENIFRRAKRTVITTSVSPETLLSFIGTPTSKMLIRNTEIIQL